MAIELICCTQTLLREIDNKDLKRDDVAKTYALAIVSSETVKWHNVNAAIIDRLALFIILNTNKPFTIRINLPST